MCLVLKMLQIKPLKLSGHTEDQFLQNGIAGLQWPAGLYSVMIRLIIAYAPFIWWNKYQAI